MSRFSMFALAVIFSEVFLPTKLCAEFTRSSPLHHMFNANLLAPGEAEISIVGNTRIGVTDQLEIGTQAAMLMLSQAPNISFKHEMFHQNDFRTAFNAHLFYSRSDFTKASKSETTASETTTSETANEPEAASSLLGYVGPMTTIAIDSDDYFSFGIYDFFVRQGWHELNRVSTIQALSPSLGFDKYFTKNWAVTAALAYPVYLILHDESDLADIKGAISFVGHSTSRIDPSIGFLTATYGGETTNFEFGALFLAGRYVPYANCFWRFN